MMSDGEAMVTAMTAYISTSAMMPRPQED